MDKQAKSNTGDAIEALGWPVNAFIKEALAGGISRAALYSMWHRGEGPRRTRLGRRVMILKSDAEEWLTKLPKE